MPRGNGCRGWRRLTFRPAIRVLTDPIEEEDNSNLGRIDVEEIGKSDRVAWPRNHRFVNRPTRDKIPLPVRRSSLAHQLSKQIPVIALKVATRTRPGIYPSR